MRASYQVDVKTNLKAHLSPSRMPFVFQGSRKAAKSPQSPFQEKPEAKPQALKNDPNLNLPSSKNDFLDMFSYYETQIQLSEEEISSQANHHLSLIQDTLWKKVCIDVAHTMGQFSVLILWNTRLENISSQDKVANIYCSTEGAAQFLDQYAFVILGSLRQYFPALKEIRSQKGLKSTL